MFVREVMSRRVDFVDRSDTVQEAAQKMGRDNVGLLAVFDGNFAVGIVTDRDITLRVVARGLNPMRTRVHEIMSEDICFCSDTDTLETAAFIMEKKQVRRLLVENADNHVVGVISLADLAKCRADELVSEVLNKITLPAHPRW
ncbi:MAG: CBS domain-containing protein [Chitinispirillaceae bacterium]